MNEQIQNMNQQIAATAQQLNLLWLQEEVNEMKANSISGERLPTLKLESGKITKFTVLVDKPFEEYTDMEKGTVKKIIPVLEKGIKKNLWLNKKNPLYRQLSERILNGQTEFYISTSGMQDQTRYEIQEFN
jgi:hypothetical protein